MDLSCIVCRREGLGETPAEIHHVRVGQGMSQRSKHIGGTLPLCCFHHRLGACGVAIHAGQETWEKKFGTETELLEAVKELLE